MSRLTKTILFIGIFLLAYGYVCRIAPINFFWDSKAIGFIILLITLLSYWIDLYRTRKLKGKKNGWVRLGLYFVSFCLIFLPILITKLKSSDAYIAAIEYLKANPEIRKEIGTIKGFGLITTGSSKTIKVNGIESGSAIFEIIVKGEKKYKDVVIELVKNPSSPWTTIDLD